MPQCEWRWLEKFWGSLPVQGKNSADLQRCPAASYSFTSLEWCSLARVYGRGSSCPEWTPLGRENLDVFQKKSSFSPALGNSTILKWASGIVGYVTFGLVYGRIVSFTLQADLVCNVCVFYTWCYHLCLDYILRYNCSIIRYSYYRSRRPNTYLHYLTLPLDF